MKSNFVIAGCVITLISLAAALVLLTAAPVATTVSHTQTTSYNWYFKPREDGGQPIVADNAPFIADYDVIYLGDPAKKDIYLTFDVGYENGNTEKILDVLKEAQACAAFFVTGHYVKSNPALVKRMAEEGHLVCNHTLNHKDLSAISRLDDFRAEIDGLAAEYKAVTGSEMPRYLRPPEGKYSEACLRMTAEEGYTMVFWSFAYKDWLNDDQPSTDDAKQKILSRTHNGAVILLHSNSATNAAILGDVISCWRKDGYCLKSLDDFAAAPAR